MARGTIIAAGMVCAIVGAIVPIYFIPKIKPDAYRTIQKDTRKDIVQEDIQPGDMKVWSDPFDRKKE